MSGAILKDVHYYDVKFEVEADILALDRIYVFDDDNFTANDYQLLDELYRQLPGYLANAQYPCWFGENDEAGFYLMPSMEPPGLQINGRIPQADFAKWEKRFHELLAQANFPYRKL